MAVDAFSSHSVAAVNLMDISSFLHQSNALFSLLSIKALRILFLKCLVHVFKMVFFCIEKKKMHHVLVSSINSKEFLFFGYLKQKKKKKIFLNINIHVRVRYLLI